MTEGSVERHASWGRGGEMMVVRDGVIVKPVPQPAKRDGVFSVNDGAGTAAFCTSAFCWFGTRRDEVILSRCR